MHLFIERSNSCLLDVTIKAQYDDRGWGSFEHEHLWLIDGLVHTTYRWCSLTVDSASFAPVHVTFDYIQHLNFPRLEHLKVIVGDIMDDEVGLVDALASGGSRLSSISLWGLSYRWLRPPLVAIKTLKLTYVPELGYDEFCDALTSSPSLEILEIDGSAVPADTFGTPVGVSSLRVLRISYGSSWRREAPIDLLAPFEAPNRPSNFPTWTENTRPISWIPLVSEQISDIADTET
jgi:hypothetical protein